MADYCIVGYLDIFVQPGPAGYALGATISSWLQTYKKQSHTQIYDLIQGTEWLPAEVKALEPEHIRIIMDWMVAQGLIGRAENQQITYVPA